MAAEWPALPPLAASVVQLLEEASEAYPDRPAVTFGDLTLTYAEYRQAVAALAARWQRSVTPGDRIVLALPNSLDMAIGMFAAHAVGAQVVPVNPAYRPTELRRMLVDAAPRLIVHSTAAAPALRELRGELTAAEWLDVGDSGIAFRPDSAGRKSKLPSLALSPEMLATLQYTGGTSGLPKGVNITHRQLVVNQLQREALLSTEQGGETMLCVMPLFHVSAVAMCLHMACHRAAHLVILPRYRPDWVVEAIARHRVTLISGAPRIFQSLLGFEGLHGADLGSLRFCYSGAAPLPEVILQRWEEATGAPLLEGYGMTEAGPVLTYNPVHGPRKPGSVGISVPWSSLEIVDPERRDQVLSPGTEGEIRVRGPHVMAGYRNLPADTAHALADGWLYTGDIGRLDQDGYLFITGRKGERLNVGGFKVYPSEVDHVLLAHPDVAEAAAVGVADSRYGHVVHAYVVMRPQAEFDEAALIAHCRRHLVDYKVPHVIRPLEALPATAAGKLARRQLAALADEQAAPTPAAR